MKFTILYDNTVYKEGLQADWGFSCWIEVFRPVRIKILFDTGADGSIRLSNDVKRFEQVYE